MSSDFVCLGHFKPFTRKFSCWWAQNTLDFYSLGALLLSRRAKVKKHWFSKKKQVNTGWGKFYFMKFLHFIASFSEPIHYLEKFITWQNKSIQSPPGYKPNQTILFNYRWIITPLNFLKITSASFCFLTDGRWWMKTF